MIFMNLSASTILLLVLTTTSVVFSAKAEQGQISLLGQYSRTFEDSYAKIIQEENPRLAEHCQGSDFLPQWHAAPQGYLNPDIINNQGPLMEGGYYVTFSFEYAPQSEGCQSAVEQLKNNLNRYPHVEATFLDQTPAQ
jgi:hypothetical protein